MQPKSKTIIANRTNIMFSHRFRYIEFVLCITLLCFFTSASAKVIYETDYESHFDGEYAWGGGNFTTTMPTWSPAPSYSSAFNTTSSSGYCVRKFNPAIDLQSYTNVKVIIDYGSSSSRPLYFDINHDVGSFNWTQVHKMSDEERNSVISVSIDVNESSISHIAVKSSGGGEVYFFHLAITGDRDPDSYKLYWSDGLVVDDTVHKFTTDADFTYTAISKTESTGAITYSSSNTDIATIDATTGQVHLEGGLGVAVITATQAADDTFPEESITYFLDVFETEIIDQTRGPIYYDDHNSSEFCFEDMSHCLQEYVYPIFVTAIGATGYQWQQSADGEDWTNMTDSVSSSFKPSIPHELEDSVVTYYRCQVTGSVTLYSEPVKVIIEPAKGCYPNYRIEACVTGNKTMSVTGTIPDFIKTECVLEGNKAEYEGKIGYKMGDDKHHVAITLTGGYTFKEGDIVRVFVTKVGDYGSQGDSTLHIYSDISGDSAKHIGSIDGLQQGWNEWYLPASAGTNIKTICLYRHGKSNDSIHTNQNHWIYEMQVIRLEDCWDCASQDPSITIHASGNPPQLFKDSIYEIEGSLEGALSGYWTEKSDASKFGDVRNSKTTIKFTEAGTYTLTWTVSDQHSHNRWGCRKTTEKTVEVFQAFPIEMHSACEHVINQRPDSVSPTITVTYQLEGCTDAIGKYLPNDQLYVEAIADDPCDKFTKWSDNNTDNPRIFVIGNNDFTITPIFEKVQINVELSTDPDGKGDVIIEKDEP